MDTLIQNKLFEKYPKIFKQKDLPMTQTCMCWGIDCNNGWYWLIDKLCEKLQYDIDNNNQPQIEATQVKQKFGGLRFYVAGSNEFQFEIINFAEFLSYSICEKCGTTKDVKQNTGGYIQSLCSRCRKEDEKNA